MDKSTARKYALTLRKNVIPSISSEKVLMEIMQSKIINDNQHIGIYYPIGKEIDILSLVKKYPNKKFYLPVTKEELYFVPYTADTLLVQGPFHTKEPKGEVIPREKITCFFIPCVAISKDNKRIGYGKGYYDRYLQNYKGIKVGICYANSADLDVSCDDFDIELDYKFLG